MTVTAPAASTLSMQWRFDTRGSVTLTAAPEPEPRMMLSSSEEASVTEPSGAVIWSEMVFLDMSDTSATRRGLALRNPRVGPRGEKGKRQRLSTDFCSSGLKLSRTLISVLKVVFFFEIA